MTRQFLICTAIAVAVLLGWLAWDGWLYLQRGYSLSISMADHPGSVFHIGFPVWRMAVHVLLWVAAMAAITAYVTGQRWASTVAWMTLAATSVVGIYDVAENGTIGSPTSIWTLVLLLLVALLTTFKPLASSVKV